MNTQVKVAVENYKGANTNQTEPIVLKEGDQT